ncbi:hypothetical protein B6U81_06850 [Thermoplasmatales archaeon ex4484_30]|nr:MAG: hypothetical protein B6U81_06850 [Thermoplasmatales archaeon ex4484_30]RLF44609.1 MAG: hypothetical protein DRN29_08140 [Thermoplasmata archaeon]
MLEEEVLLSPNEPNPHFMVYKEDARRLVLQAIAEKSECFWILGKTGIGKTTFLLWLNEYAPLYNVVPIFFHGGEKLTLDEIKSKVEETIRPSFFSRVFLKKKAIEKPILILIDEVEYIKDDNVFQYLIGKLDDPQLHASLVLASVDVVEDVIKNHFKGREIHRIYLEMPSPEIIMDMIRKRIEASGGEDFQPFGKQLVKDVIESSTTIRDILIKLGESSKYR